MPNILLDRINLSIALSVGPFQAKAILMLKFFMIMLSEPRTCPICIVPCNKIIRHPQHVEFGESCEHLRRENIMNKILIPLSLVRINKIYKLQRFRGGVSFPTSSIMSRFKSDFTHLILTTPSFFFFSQNRPMQK